MIWAVSVLSYVCAGLLLAVVGLKRQDFRSEEWAPFVIATTVVVAGWPAFLVWGLLGGPRRFP